MKTATPKLVDVSLRDDWLRTIEQLQDQVRAWVSEEPGWFTEVGEQRQVQEEVLGVYTAVSLNIFLPEGQVVLEPVARNYPGRCIVEMYAWPTAYRVRLVLHPNAGWKVLTDSGIYLRQPWDQQHFALLVRELVFADDMIPFG